ncbi:MAG: hypothetical protein CMB32_04725 [Euryarchaeota archaeon]|nr:hypothetical protein [Euryarchaeota archaeon]|tara:strand:+ start:670 stop:981 length:312 start_codon:yes stop_codon:yes gene_type:complete
MKAPKLRSIFRNVRTKPKQFAFKSRHTSDVREDWEERKRRVEQGLPNKISFKKRRGEYKKATRKAIFRALLIGVVLLYVTYRMIIWAETTEWGPMLEFIRDNG